MNSQMQHQDRLKLKNRFIKNYKKYYILRFSQEYKRLVYNKDKNIELYNINIYEIWRFLLKMAVEVEFSSKFGNSFLRRRCNRERAITGIFCRLWNIFYVYVLELCHQ